MSQRKTYFIIAVGLVIAGLIVGLALMQKPGRIMLRRPVNTAGAAYPFALKFKDGFANNAFLVGVIVYLDCKQGGFSTRTITYAFQNAKTHKTIFVVVDNPSRAAFVLSAEESPRNSLIPASDNRELKLAGAKKDVPDVLRIALADRLAEFCRAVPPNARDITLVLSSQKVGPVWSLSADGWDARGPIAELSMQVNAVSGAILGHSFEKAKGR